MTLSLIIQPQPTQIELESAVDGEFTILAGSLLDIDIITSESHENSVQITDHPVEDGANITDHVIQNPDRITLTGAISNNPIQISIVTRSPPGRRRAEDSYQVMRAALKSGALFNISTELHDYDSMVMESLSVARNPGNANGVEFTATFKHVRFVSSIEVAGAVQPTRKTKPKRPTKEVSEVKEEKVSSFLSTITR